MPDSKLVEKLGRLKELAEKATPGPWKTRYNGLFICPAKAPYLVIMRPSQEHRDGSGFRFAKTFEQSQNNYEFIAAANPQAITELVDLCLELSERLAEIRAAYAIQEKCSHYVGDPVICDACLYERQKKMVELLADPERKDA